MDKEIDQRMKGQTNAQTREYHAFYCRKRKIQNFDFVNLKTYTMYIELRNKVKSSHLKFLFLCPAYDSKAHDDGLQLHRCCCKDICL